MSEGPVFKSTELKPGGVEAMMAAQDHVCQHGQLQRQCYTCALEEEVKRLRKDIAVLRYEILVEEKRFSDLWEAVSIVIDPKNKDLSLSEIIAKVREAMK
jgi:hypothetical protein